MITSCWIRIFIIYEDKKEITLAQTTTTWRTNIYCFHNMNFVVDILERRNQEENKRKYLRMGKNCSNKHAPFEFIMENDENTNKVLQIFISMKINHRKMIRYTVTNLSLFQDNKKDWPKLYNLNFLCHTHALIIIYCLPAFHLKDCVYLNLTQTKERRFLKETTLASRVLWIISLIVFTWSGNC